MPGVRCRILPNADTRHLIPDTPVNETNHFFNIGYGWVCKHCSAEDAERNEERSGLWRFFQMREADRIDQQNPPRLPTLVLARWTDAARRSLKCPRCGIEEMVSKA